MRTANWALALVTLTALGGCAAADPVDDFRRAVPSAEALMISVPGGEATGASRAALSDDVGVAAAALIGQRADYYQISRDVSRGINGGLVTVLAIIHAVAQTEPIAADDDHAVFEPPTATLNPLAYRLVVARTAPERYEFVLSGKPKAADEGAFVALVAGHSEGDETGGAGELAIDFDAGHALDASEHPEQGYLIATWQIDGEGRRVEAALEADEGGDSERIPALYRYSETTEGAGTFEFLTRADVGDDGTQLEDVYLTSRWNETGAGRGDAVVAGGDVPTGTAVFFSECWDRGFGRTFFGMVGGPSEGDAALCAYGEPLWSEDAPSAAPGTDDSVGS